ncbi:hypothetical protein GCM10025771_13780 [Niveibacterium umoris]|uniref:Uncharacterized protein n=2 Tax=Niveibacterium umoris TaxID=1193620 RepID=A0A840BN90_9RHOO|nr:hypothetical protein [Niveibacterium umoris]MBB4014981.1 hypothetical protein [Niveibacterium umoris]
MQKVIYFAIGAVLIVALIASSYSLAICALLIAGAYQLSRAVRWIDNEGTLFPSIAPAPYDCSDFEVISETEDEIIIRGSVRALSLHKSKRIVSNVKGPLCTFDKVRCVTISESSSSQEGYGTSYAVSLSLGFFSSVCLGFTSNKLEASIAAAKLSTWTGKHVSV